MLAPHCELKKIGYSETISRDPLSLSQERTHKFYFFIVQIATVKTHILIIDRALARRSESVLFVEIENDGYSQTDTREPVAGSQLDTAKDAISSFEKSLRDGKPWMPNIGPGSNANTTFENWPLNSSSKKRMSLNMVATSRVGFLKIGPQPYAPKQMSE